jgi:hypothetical protein
LLRRTKGDWLGNRAIGEMTRRLRFERSLTLPGIELQIFLELF